MQKRKQPRAAGGGKTVSRSKERRLVPLDQEPLRRAASSECGQALATLEKLRENWRHYEQEDVPAFERWRASTFGALLSKLRETETLLREKEALVREVEAEVVFGRARNYREAYARVQERRKNPPKAAEPPPPRDRFEESVDDEGEEEEGELDELEQEMLFDEFLRSVMGINPERMSDLKYEKMFREFQDNFLGGDGRAAAEAGPAAPAPKPQSNRLKEIYRVLVRRLHPDTRADIDPTVAALWHDVQEAYQTGNVERLEMLLALTEMQDNAPGEKTSLFQMRAVLEELRGAIRALKRSLRDARQDPAWNFLRGSDRAALRKKLQRGLEGNLAEDEAVLQRLEHLIRQWSVPPAVRPSQKRKGKRVAIEIPVASAQANPKAPVQQDLPF